MFYVIVPTYSREMGYRKNVFGPYSNWEKAQEVSDKVGPGEIVELPTGDISEAVRILEEEGR